MAVRRAGGWCGAALALLLLLVRAGPTVAFEDACFELKLYDSYGDGWSGAAYMVFEGPLLVANGTLEGGFNATDALCLTEESCYVMRVTEGDWPGEVGWSLEALSGGAVDEAHFQVTTGGELVEVDSCSTASPTTTARTPTTPTLTTTSVATGSCFRRNCVVDLAFDTSTSAKYVAFAALTVDLDGDFDRADEFVRVVINGVDVGGCGDEAYPAFDCLAFACFDALDVTAFAKTGKVAMSFSPSVEVDFPCGGGGGDGGHVLRARATLAVTLAETTSPTVSPTTSLSPTSSPSPAPTSFSPRTFVATATCAEKNCLETLTFDTSAFAASVAAAELAVRLWGDFRGHLKDVDVRINGADVGTCGGDAVSGGGQGECVDAICFDGRDATASARRGTVAASFAISPAVDPICGENPPYAMRAEATLVVVLAETTYPTTRPSSPAPSSPPSRMPPPSTTGGRNEIITTFHDLSASLRDDYLYGGRIIQVRGLIPFDERVDVTSTGRHVRGGGGGAVFDGNETTSLFRLLQAATLTLENVTLQNGWGAFGGCAQAADGSFLELRGVVLRNCTAYYGGGFFLEGGAVLRASESLFTALIALEDGGAAYLRSSSRFEADASDFRSNAAVAGGGVAFVHGASAFMVNRSSLAENTAYARGGVVAVYASSTFTATNSSFVRDEAIDAGGVAFVDSSTFTAVASRFDGCVVGKDGGVAYLVSSVFTATSSVFYENSAYAEWGGVAWVSENSVFRTEDSRFERNTAGGLGGVAYLVESSSFTAYDASFDANGGVEGGVAAVTDSSSFTAEASSFRLNYASMEGGVAFLETSSSLTAINSSYESNLALSAGSIALQTSASIIELYNSSLRDQRDALRCQATGTTYAALLDLELTETFDLDPNCVLFLYQINNNGSAAFRDAFIANNVVDLSSSGVNFIHWSFPCGPGRWSPDGIEHGNDCVDGNGLTIDENDQFCSTANGDDGRGEEDRLPDCAASCETCPAGKFLEFTLNRFKHVGRDSCSECPIGKHLEDPGEETRRWWLHDDPSDCVDCPAGRFANKTASRSCMPCAAGTFAPNAGSIVCTVAEPGFYVGDAATFQSPCPAGRTSVGAADACVPCARGQFQPEPESTQCRPADPGSYVDTEAATETRPCPPGTFSLGGSEKCVPCPVGTFNPRRGEASCVGCPSPTTTRRQGAEYCDACIRSYFWNSLYWTDDFDRGLVQNGTQCVDCCSRCEDVCDVEDDGPCVKCDDDGAELETLEVKRGWWRATKHALEVYACPLDRSCRGGSSTADSERCYDGHVGALCGACDENYDFDVARNRCVGCTSAGEVLVRSGNLCLVGLIAGLVGLALYARYCNRKRWRWQAAWVWLKESALQGALSASTDLGVAEGISEAIDEGDEVQDDDRARRKQRFRKSVLTKLKIIVAAMQIASSTDTVLLHVRFPAVFSKFTNVFGIFGFFFFDVGSFRCLFQWSYFHKLVFVTVAPALVPPLAAGPYWLLQRRRGKLDTEGGRRDVTATLTYATLLFLYVVLPSVSTYLITFFSCQRFDRGNRGDLRVIATELSIRCTSRRYRRWACYAVLMIAVWPGGATMGLALLLWKHRAKLNPRVTSPMEFPTALTSRDLDGFARDRRRYSQAMEQLRKVAARNDDEAVKGLAFLFEEYEPRCYLFPVFELARRLFLSSVLAAFYPGSMQQAVVGLLGAMLSYVVYSHYEAFIEDDDDVVATVAQGQLVLIYFAALAVYTSDVGDEKRGFFSSGLFGAVLILVFFASFIVAVYVTLLEVFGYSSLQRGYRDVAEHARRTSKRWRRSTATSNSHRRRLPSNGGGGGGDVKEEKLPEDPGLVNGRSFTDDNGDDISDVASSERTSLGLEYVEVTHASTFFSDTTD